LPRIDILQAALDSACLVKAAQRDGADGLVINGLGRGHVPPNWVEDISEAAISGVPIAITSSSDSGPVGAVYEFPGSLADLLKAGVMSAGDLTARKARILMMVLLSRGWRGTELAGHLGQAGIWGEGEHPQSPGSQATFN
jgi:L-asparaginase